MQTSYNSATYLNTFRSALDGNREAINAMMDYNISGNTGEIIWLKYAIEQGCYGKATEAICRYLSDWRTIKSNDLDDIRTEVNNMLKSNTLVVTDNIDKIVDYFYLNKYYKEATATVDYIINKGLHTQALDIMTGSRIFIQYFVDNIKTHVDMMLEKNIQIKEQPINRLACYFYNVMDYAASLRYYKIAYDISKNDNYLLDIMEIYTHNVDMDNKDALELLHNILKLDISIKETHFTYFINKIYNNFIREKSKKEWLMELLNTTANHYAITILNAMSQGIDPENTIRELKNEINKLREKLFSAMMQKINNENTIRELKTEVNKLRENS